MGFQGQDSTALPQQALTGPGAPAGGGQQQRPPAHPLSWMSSSASMVDNLSTQSLSLSSPSLGAASTAAKPPAAQGAPFTGMYDGGPGGTAAKPAATASSPAVPYQSPYASVYLSGITDEKQNAVDAGRHVNGHDSGVALYEGQNPGGDATRNPNAGSSDQEMDLLAVTQFARLGDQVQVDKSGNVQMNQAALAQQVQIGSNETGEKYMSPLEMGSQGAQAAIKSNPALAKKMEKGGDPRKDPALAQEFISITGHSGGGQSSFYTAIELHQRGFKNISVVGYDMAISPHEREVMEKVGIQVTNVTGHAGTKDNYVNSPVGEGIRAGMGGDDHYYDASIDRGGGEKIVEQHGVVNNDRATVMLRYATWLDAHGKHKQFTDENYQLFLKDTGGTGDMVSGADGKTHESQSPLGGSFDDYSKRKESTYLKTPEWKGQDLINGVSSIPGVGGWLGQKVNNLATGMVPDFKDTKLPQLDVGINPNLQTQGSVDAKRGAAQGSVNLSGSTIDVAGAHLTAPQWAQASGGVNASQGAANVNIGGAQGLSADVNLAKGNLDLKFGSHDLNIGQGLRNAWHWASGH